MADIFWIVCTNADIISIWLDAQKHLQIASLIISLRNKDLRPILSKMMLRGLGVNHILPILKWHVVCCGFKQVHH